MAHKAVKGSKGSAYGKGKDYAAGMKEDMSKAMKPMMGGKTPKK